MFSHNTRLIDTLEEIVLDYCAEITHLNFLNQRENVNNTIISFRRLKTLKCTRMIKLQSGLQYLSHLCVPILSKLHLIRCEKIQDDQFQYLPNLSTSIEDLDLTRSIHNDDHVQNLSHLYRLKRINLNSCRQVTGSGFIKWYSDFQSLCHVQELKLEWCKVLTNEVLYHVANKMWPSLKSLYLFDSGQITDITPLCKCTQLQLLSLRGVIPGVHDAAIQLLCQHLVSLEELVIHSDLITNASMKSIVKLKKLAILNINFNPNIDNKGIKLIAPLFRTLRELDVKRSYKITSKCTQYLPFTNISFDSKQQKK